MVFRRGYPPSAQGILPSYADRPTPGAAPYPTSPIPALGTALGAVLAAGGSAPGADGTPYEVYHHGARFVATLLIQAFHVAARSPEAHVDILGAWPELLLWIPKLANASTAHQMRPLQLPPCLQRLLGTTLTAHVGPSIESRLTPFQAAKRGGHCGGNIQALLTHLTSRAPPTSAPSHAMMRTLLGPCYEAVCVMADLHPGGAWRGGPAAFLADQSKAFERIATAWILLVFATSDAPLGNLPPPEPLSPSPSHGPWTPRSRAARAGSQHRDGGHRQRSYLEHGV